MAGGRPPSCCSCPPAAGALIVLADADGAAAKLLAVHALDGVVHRVVVPEVDEAEPAGSARLPVGDDLTNQNTNERVSAHGNFTRSMCKRGKVNLETLENNKVTCTIHPKLTNLQAMNKTSKCTFFAGRSIINSTIKQLPSTNTNYTMPMNTATGHLKGIDPMSTREKGANY